MTSSLDLAIRYGSLLLDLDDRIDGHLKVTVEADHTQWTISLAADDGWAMTVHASTADGALKKAVKAIDARALNRATR